MSTRWWFAVAVLLVTVSVMCASGGRDAADITSTPRLNIGQTYINGINSKSYGGREFYSFKGIPYAKPPLGELRFKAPQPLSLGAGEINATQDAPMCTQKNYLLTTPSLSGQEDCLYLNVYTPQVGVKANLPVMVYIHGGGWFTGTGASYINGADYLMDKNVVLVTFNYRLGALGFLSTGDDAAPGNYGFKDQVAVLTWVRDHIRTFGGDPDVVTIFGQSAGAVSVHYHMLSPLSRGLFHRAISESGTAMSLWARPGVGSATARRQGEFVGCRQEDSVELVACLRQVDALNLTDSGDNFHFWSIDPLVTYGPVLEREGADAFLTDYPMSLINAGQFTRVPWLMGSVAQEGIIRALPIVSDATLLASLNAQWTSLGPRLLEIDVSFPADLVDEVWANVTRFYLNDKLPLLSSEALGFIDLYSDRSFVRGIHTSALLHARQGHSNVFMYNFQYPGLYSYAALFAQNPTKYGVSHCDDLIYLFRAPALFPDWPQGHPDVKVMEVMTTLWTTFAKQGTPTPFNDNAADSMSCDLESSTPCNLDSLLWCPMSTTPDADADGKLRTLFLHIALNTTNNASTTLDFEMDVDLYKERMEFWDTWPLTEESEGGAQKYVVRV